MIGSVPEKKKGEVHSLVSIVAFIQTAAYGGKKKKHPKGWKSKRDLAPGKS